MLAHLNSIIHILGAKFCLSTYVMCHRRSNMTQYLWYLSGVGALDKKAGGEIDGTEMELFPLSYSLDSTLLYLGNLYILIQEMYIHKTKFLYFIQVRKKFFSQQSKQNKNWRSWQNFFNHNILQKFEHLFSNWHSKTITVRLSSDFSLEVLDLEHGDAGKYICEVVVWLNF